MFIPQKQADRNQIAPPEPGRYVVYGWQQSYFTRKLTAALHFYGAPHELRRKTPDIEREVRMRSGTHQVPLLHTPENWMIADTTPLLRMLDGRFPGREMFPAGLAGFVVHVLEEFFDEWIARTSVHWRWAYEENHELLSMDAAEGDPEVAKALVDWGVRVRRATGVSSETQQRACEQEYHRILAAAESQLAETQYLLGDRPTAVDCIALAGLRAHFDFDPAPRRAIHDRYPRVIAWSEGGADSWSGGGELAPVPASTPFARHVLGEISAVYRPFVLGNRAALAAREKAFVVSIYGEDVSYLARPYVERSRQMVTAHLNALGPEDQAAARSWLHAANLSEAFAT